MHEMSIAIELLRQLQAVARENALERIDEFTVRAGAMRQIVPEALTGAFEVLAEGTCAEAADVNVEIEPLAATCCNCGARFEVGLDTFACSRCGQADVEIVAGNEIVLTSVTGRQREGATVDED